MTFNPHTDRDREEMLSTIGVSSIEELFTPIPKDLRFPNLDLPPALTEMEAAARLSELAGKNQIADESGSFLGAGSYRHFVPATVNNLIQRGELFTAYTPYQPEVSQGTLQIIYEFQSMVANLFDLEIANASLYDGATAVAEAMLMAVAAAKKRNKVVVSGTLHPSYRGVVETYTAGSDIDLIQLPLPVDGLITQPDDLASQLDESVAAVILQYPNFFGGIEEIERMAEIAHSLDAAVIVSCYPVSLALLKAPGVLGADIATAEGQSLGVAQCFGGPYLGLLAAKQRYVRQMPGRMAGRTTDMQGKRGFVLTLQTREQHIRREKATSNICTNQGLMATAATIHMSTLGPQGLREAALRSYHNAHYLLDQLTSMPGVELVSSPLFFNEFTLRMPAEIPSLNEALAASGMIGGYDLGVVDESLSRHWLLSATEMNSKASIGRLVEIVRMTVA
jgi:glycine dehydrogenase subunit 1